LSYWPTALLRFAVKRVLPFPRAILHQFDPSWIVRFVLLCRIVSLRALSALERNDGS